MPAAGAVFTSFQTNVLLWVLSGSKGPASFRTYFSQGSVLRIFRHEHSYNSIFFVEDISQVIIRSTW